jgi:uncharacterized ion transporter superfamily protein YfcC
MATGKMDKTEAKTAASVAESAPKPKWSFTFPSAYTILFVILIIVTALTWIIPAGLYQLDAEGKPVPGTYHTVPRNPQRFFQDTLLAPIDGMYGLKDLATGHISVDNVGVLYGSINIALFVLVIGGFLGITMKTGAIDAGIGAAVKRLGTRGNLLIPIMMIIFMAGGTTYGMAEETLAFYAVIITALIALGYDALTGVAVVMLGAGIGTLASTINPFATGIASGIAGVPLGEGIVLRIAILILCGAAGIWWVMRYAARVKADPSTSYVADKREANEEFFLRRSQQKEVVELTTQRKWILSLFGLAFLIMVYSVIPWSDLGVSFLPTLGWWFPQLTALFLVFAIIIGLVGRMHEGALTATFIDGARDLLGVALIVAVARGISVIMANGLITDTILNWISQVVSHLSSVAFINTVFLLYVPLAFVIPSSSGLATVTMPIMAPLASFAGVPESLVVTAYQSASGLINLFTPTFAVVAGGLAIGRVPLNTWWKFVFPLVGILAVIVMVMLSIGVLIK